MGNRTWLVKANEKICNHRKAFREIGKISWHMEHTRFAVGDVVYVYFSDRKLVEIKAEVVKVNTTREDSAYWNGNAPDDICATFEFKKRVNDPYLNEDAIMKHGYKKGSLQSPLCNNPELFEYLDLMFERN